MYLSAPRFLDPFLSRVRPKLASSIQSQINPEGALFLPSDLSPADLNDCLRERAIAAVMLPPFYNEAEIELLIADEDLDRVGDLVTKWPGRQSIKLYSATGGRREHRFDPPGLPVSGHYAVSLFPPHLAEALIDRSEPGAEGIRALSSNDAFFACAYRAAYLQSGCWERERSDWIATAECDALIREKAAGADLMIDGPITPRKLDHFLTERGWRPSRDLLERAAHWMPWIRDILPAGEVEETPGLSVFFLRSRAVEAGWQSRILESLRENGFEPLSVVELDEGQAQKAARDFRGGNWGRGPYKVSGGPPATLCVALDLLPIRVDEDHRAEFPDADNRRIADAKDAARDLVNAGIARPLHYNPVHSTDNSAQAWRAIGVIMPAEEAELRGRVEELRREFASENVIRDLTKHGRRAKVELVEFDGKPAIRKTFRPSALHFMQREIDVMERLAPLCEEVPRLLDRGSNQIVMEYVGGGAMPPPKRRADAPPRPLPLNKVRRLAELITISMANGFDPIDLRADGNIIYSGSGLHLIDFEYWRACEPGPPERSMCLSGIPIDDVGQRPRAGLRNKDPYRIGWYPYTLLSVDSFLHDPAPVQRMKRAANFSRAYGAWLARTSYRFAGRTIKRGARKAMTIGVSLIGPRAMRLLAIE